MNLWRWLATLLFAALIIGAACCSHEESDCQKEGHYFCLPYVIGEPWDRYYFDGRSDSVCYAPQPYYDSDSYDYFYVTYRTNVFNRIDGSTQN